MQALRAVIFFAVIVAACATNKPQPEPQAVKPEPAAKVATVAPAPAPAPAPAEPIAQPVKPVQTNEPTTSVYFAFDSAFLTDTSRAKLAHVFDAANAPGARIRIEGNCDERGTVEYNIGLGQRRADAAKKYLVGIGIPADRIETISYGKERPKAPGHDEESWKENRRGDVFVRGAAAVSLR